MKERPILFSGPMVRAILEGRKSMTRRAVKPHVSADTVRFDYYSADSQWREMFVADNLGNLYPKSWSHKCPYGVPGDRLWVRETHGFASGDGPGGDPTSWVEYRADGESDEIRRWRPSIFMPRWASRITLGVTGVRVERLQEITEEDARAEGCKPDMREEAFTVVCRGGGTFEVSSLYERGVPKVGEMTPFGEVTHVEPIPGKVVLTAREAFRDLWRKINGRESWAANPWVWVVEFMRVDQA